VAGFFYFSAALFSGRAKSLQARGGSVAMLKMAAARRQDLGMGIGASIIET
jgi:hypothetical protein